MTDLRPAFYVIGLLVIALGAMMLPSALFDFYDGNKNWRAFALTTFWTTLFGLLMSVACRQQRRTQLTLTQAFVLTTFSWVFLSFFAALPLMLGAPNLSLADAVFESVSGLTTTGATVVSGLDDLPRGALFWRGMLQWIGGLGIVVVALAFLPVMKIGGMQFFRSEAFDTSGKILPAAGQIAVSLISIYGLLTVGCALAYYLDGMHAFDATVHSFTTISTGGFANYDASLGHFDTNVEYIAVVFMILASVPFIRMVQFMQGNPKPFFKDSQIQSYIAGISFFVIALTLYRIATSEVPFEANLRETLFNTVSIMSGTGYASVDYTLWGPFSVTMFFMMGLIGGCSGSTGCSVKIFRYQIIYAAAVTAIKRIHTPHGVFITRYQGRRVDEELISSVMSYMFMFFLSLAVVSIGMGMLGYDTITAVSAAATALANIGPGLGDIIGPSGNFSSLSDPAKWLLSFAMLVGRLEIMTVFAMFSVGFWRN